MRPLERAGLGVCFKGGVEGWAEKRDGVGGGVEAGWESVISRRARGSVGWLLGVMLRGGGWEAKSEGGWGFGRGVWNWRGRILS